MRIELRETGVVFDPINHTYTYEGKQLRGITGIIHDLLYPDEFDNIPADILQAATIRGSRIHESIQRLDDDFENDGTPEVQDYMDLCISNGWKYERSEYNVSDFENISSNIDKVFRLSDTEFSLADIKTYSTIDDKKLMKAKFQLSVYKYLFELTNPGAKVKDLFVIHLNSKHGIKAVYPIKAIPSDFVKDFLDCGINGGTYINPFEIPTDIKSQEKHILELLEEKERIETELSELKSDIYNQMETMDVKSWIGEYLRLTRKTATTRTSLDSKAFQRDHPEIYKNYIKTSQVQGSLVVAAI